MDIQAAERAISRARKAARHATRQLDAATTPRAKARQERRLRNATRSLTDAARTFSLMALTDA